MKLLITFTVTSTGSKVTQTGSRSQMLSPLFVKTNSAPQEHPNKPKTIHSEISPEMIYEALRNLTLWKQEVQTGLIFEFIRMHYPVNKEDNELYLELYEKLRIASLIGMVVQTKEDLWCLTCKLQQHQLTTNHVTLFWKAYADTLNPLIKKEPVLKKERSDQQTNTRLKAGGVNEDDII
ncbi:hypothetical protein B5X24_HaOG201608 [Helicoverpa armigera]|nr:hypothetical protein B5X24_HaOG201608 [Helicoverpa armigera]